MQIKGDSPHEDTPEVTVLAAAQFCNRRYDAKEASATDTGVPKRFTRLVYGIMALSKADASER